MGIFSIIKKSNTLYFPGCIAYFKEKDNFQLWKDIFSRLGIDFKVSDKKICCGLPALEAGYDSESRKLARRNFEIFKEEKTDKIITTCPLCYKMFIQDYKKYLPDWNIEIINIWELILKKLEEKPGLIKNKEEIEVVFQDSCYLGRYCGIYNEPRKVLGLIGYKIKEFKDNKESSFCSGCCGGLPRTNPLLADKAAKEKLLQAKRVGIKNLVVCSLEEYNLLKKNNLDTGVEILEFSEVLAYALGIKKKETEKDIAISEPAGSPSSKASAFESGTEDSKITSEVEVE